MVKIERSCPAPESLAIEAKKKSGSYEKEDVVERLRKDFHNKCYICEMKDLQDPQVEHLLPHKNGTYPERKFDWDNLFWACGHCNGVKNNSKYDDGIIDCCKEDPEAVLYFRLQNEEVRVGAFQEENELAQRTAELIQEVFMLQNTGMRMYTSAERTRLLQEQMNILYKQLEKFKKNPESKVVLRTLRGLLGRDSAFAAFKRCYVREHKQEYPELLSYVE